MGLNFLGCLIIDRILQFFLGNAKMRSTWYIWTKSKYNLKAEEPGSPSGQRSNARKQDTAPWILFSLFFPFSSCFFVPSSFFIFFSVNWHPLILWLKARKQDRTWILFSLIFPSSFRCFDLFTLFFVSSGNHWCKQSVFLQSFFFNIM